MKAQMIKLIIFLTLGHSILSAKLKCYKGFDFTKNGVENVNKTFVEVECSVVHHTCVSAKGSYIHQGNSCELLNI